MLALPVEGDGRRPSTASRGVETPASRGRAGRLGRQGMDAVLNESTLRAAAAPPASTGGPRASGPELLHHVLRALPVRHQGRLWQRRNVHSASRSCSRGTFPAASEAPTTRPRGAGSQVLAAQARVARQIGREHVAAAKRLQEGAAA